MVNGTILKLAKILQDAFKDAKRIFVIGEIKKLWLERFNFNVTDINEMGYPSFNYPRSVTICTNHNGACKTTCAMYNVKRMNQFYRILAGLRSQHGVGRYYGEGRPFIR